MKSRDEILADLRKQVKTASLSEKVELRKFVDRLIEQRMQLVNESAQHAVTGLTPRYRQAFLDMIENDRIWLSGLESIKQELNSN
jgi:tyrosine-protein phosphatase YwqE